MKILTYIFVLYFFISENVCSGNEPYQNIFSYKGIIDVRTSSTPYSPLARWTISSNLIVQYFEDYSILQLRDIKTSLFNGDRDNLTLTEEQDVPAVANAFLSKPFVLQYIDKNLTINVTSDEPSWSVNMKRSIADNFHIDVDPILLGSKKSKEFVKLIKNKKGSKYSVTTTENTLHGICEVKYNVETSGDNIEIDEIINYENCEDSPKEKLSNAKKPAAINGYNPLTIKTIKTYYFTFKDEILTKNHIKVSSNIIHQSMPETKTSQNIDQGVEFKNINNNMKIDEIINKNEATNMKNIIYEFDTVNYESSETEQVVNKLVGNYKEFNKKFYLTPLKHFDALEPDYVDNMFMTMLALNLDAFDKIDKFLFDPNSEYFDLQSSFYSLLPYIGTENSIKYIHSLCNQSMLEKLIPNRAIHILATFPTYIENPSEENIKLLECLLYNQNFSNPVVGYASILSFSSVVGTAIRKQTITEKQLNEYIQYFYREYVYSHSSYSNAMTHLGALINIADGLTIDHIISMVTNVTEANEFKTLGIFGFKHKMINYPDKVYNNFWPIVQNKTEDFDVRIAALDLLLSTNLTEKHFNTIVDVYKQPQETVQDKHLFKYFYTTLLSLQNVTKYPLPLGSLATKVLEDVDFADVMKISKYWTTNTILAYTDETPNFGRSLQIQAASDPKTNLINSFHVTYNQFAFSYDMGTYSIYIKLQEAIETLYKEKVKRALMNEEYTLSELMKDFKMLPKDIECNVEIVIFVNNRAVMAFYSFDELTQFINEILNIPEKIEKERFLTFPIMDYEKFPSELGTELKVTNDIETYLEYKNPSKDFGVAKYSWKYQTWLESADPLTNTWLYSYKYYGSEIKLNISTFAADNRIAIHHWNDSYESIWDQVSGTGVTDENSLKLYCPKCSRIYQIPTDIESRESYPKYALLGINFNDTKEGYELFSNRSDEFFFFYINSHMSNTNNFPYIKPLTLYMHLEDFTNIIEQEDIQQSRRSLSYYDNSTQLLMKFTKNKLDKNAMYHTMFDNVSIEFATSKHGEPFVERMWVFNISNERILNLDTNDFRKILEMKFDYTVFNKTRRLSTLSSELIFSNEYTDKYSIEPVKPAHGLIQIKSCNLKEGDANECPDNNEDTNYINISEEYWTSEKLIDEVLHSKEYETCKKQKEGFKFIPFTKECIFDTFLKLDQYDKYELIHINSSENSPFDSSNSNSIFTGTLDYKKNKVNYSMDLSPYVPPEYLQNGSHVNFILYNILPIINPKLLVYNDISDISMGFKKYCTITPKIVKSFTEKTFNFNEKQPVAMVECYNKSIRGLTVQKINDLHIGFTLFLRNNKLTATVNNGKIELKLNDTVIKDKFYNNEEMNLKIRFIEDDVIHIVEENIDIYYNTEYIFVKILNVYQTRLCGFCTN